MPIRYTNKEPVAWRIDEDGLMRVTMCVLKEGVYDYLSDEVPPDPSLQGKKIIKEFIPLQEIARPESWVTLEGKPVIITEHEWRDAQNTLSDGLTIGAVAGEPYIKNNGLYADALIYDKDTQESIKKGELVEVSAAYDGDIVVGLGDFAGQSYDATQKNFRFNHVLLLPAGRGRCGAEVRIINRKMEGNAMADKAATIKVRIGNRDRTYRFLNEEDRAEAEGMLEEQKSFNAEELQRAVEEREELKARIDELSAQLAQHDANLKAAKDELERMLSPEVQEKMAEEALSQREDEDEIIEDAVESALEKDVENETVIEERTKDEKERFANAIRQGGFAERRKRAVALIFQNQKRELPENWSQEAVDGAFEMLVLQARNRNSLRKSRPQMTLNGRPTPGLEQRSTNSARERMLRPMRLNNGKGE